MAALALLPVWAIIVINAAASIGLGLLQRLLAPKPKPQDRGKLSGDLFVQTAGYESPIAEVYGGDGTLWPSFAAATNLRAEVEGGALKLKWDLTETDQDSVKVWLVRVAGDSGGGTPSASIIPNQSPTTSTSYTIDPTEPASWSVEWVIVRCYYTNPYTSATVAVEARHQTPRFASTSPVPLWPDQSQPGYW